MAPFKNLCIKNVQDTANFNSIMILESILELHKDVGEVSWDPRGLEDGHSEVELLSLDKMLLGRSQSGHKLQ